MRKFKVDGEEFTRYTGAELFDKILALASEKCKELQKDGEIKSILDYAESCTWNGADQEVTNYQFDFFGVVDFGESEGIYADFYMKGIMHDTEKSETIRVGCMKTLETNLEAMKKMGTAVGIMTYYARKFINDNINDFSPIKEIEHYIKWKKEREAKKNEG